MIIAVDFDGVIVEDKFPEIGEPDRELVALLQFAKDAGHKLILWTSRVDDRLEEAVRTCTELGLEFDAINDGEPENLALYGTNPRKVFADIYIDDRALGFSKFRTYLALTEIIKYGGIIDGKR